jgi:Na+-transporting NADH:ubiquinone oxidoreductase subunit D
MANGPWRSLLDGFGNALGYTWILMAVAVFRELFGDGKILDVRIIPESWYMDQGGWYVNNGMMVLAPGAFILLGVIIWVQRAISGYSEEN